MKTRLLLLLLGVLCVTIANAQMRIQTDDNFVTFNVDDTFDGDDWDANGNDIYLYLFIDASDASNGISSEPLGSFPGTIMASLGADLYKVTIDLSDFYPNGTTIDEIYYTYNDNMGSQNPASGGFSGLAASYVPVTTLSTSDIEKNELSFSIVNGQLMASKNETISINVYNINGQLVKHYTNINISANTSFDLNLNKNKVYFVQLESGNTTQVIKTIH
ncbi:T9SS type A sorting domain-containing protein [Lacinutrix iliipiscaria]|uniref:T9SS type A sorting domain-containing protein n=1 Tax=Lacinutrix iliipiscaria TaxID=1230532 RepID=A0ABW5WT36_9FLAO